MSWASGFLNNALESAKQAGGQALAAAQKAAENPLEHAQKAVSAAVEAAKEAEREFERTFERMDCAIFALDARVSILEFPSEEKVERLAHLLNQQHGKNMLIVNMSEQQYDYSLFEGTVTEVQFLGLPAPPLELLAKLCLQCQEWLQQGPDRCIGLHCFTGFQRSIVFAACFLAWQGRHPHPVDALSEVCESLGVPEERILPSQKRYLTYFAAVMLDETPVTPVPQELVLKQLVVRSPPEYIDDFRPYCEVWQGGARVFTTEKDSTAVVTGPAPATFALDVPVRGDVLLRVRWMEGSARKTLFRIALHTAFVPGPGQPFQLAKRELDGHDGDKRWDAADAQVDLVTTPGAPVAEAERAAVQAEFEAARKARPDPGELCEFLAAEEAVAAPASPAPAPATIGQPTSPPGPREDPSSSTDSDLVVVTVPPVVSSGATESLDDFFNELDGIQGDEKKPKAPKEPVKSVLPDLPDFDDLGTFTAPAAPAAAPSTSQATAIDDLDDFFDEITKKK